VPEKSEKTSPLNPIKDLREEKLKLTLKVFLSFPLPTPKQRGRIQEKHNPYHQIKNIY